MSDINVGTARGVVRIDYESRGAARVTREFEQIKAQTEGTASSFATWANKIGIGSQELQRLNQIQRAVVEAQKTSNYFTLQRDNILRTGNASLSQQLNLMKLAHESQKSLVNITQVAAEAKRRLPMELATAGQISAKAFSDEFERGATARLSNQAGKGGSGGLGSVLGGLLSVGMKSTVAVAISGAVAGLAGAGSIIAGGFGRLTGIDTATYKLKALGLEGAKVQSVMKDALESVQGTQYSLDQAVNVAANAVQAGVKPGQGLVAYLKDVQGLAAVTQMDLQSVGMIMNRIQTTQRVGGEDLRELEYVGVNIMPMLQKEYGKTAAEMSKMRENGEIDAAHFNAAIRNNFGKAADIMGNSIGGSIANMKTAFSKLGANFLAPIFAPMGDKPALIVNVIKGIQSAVDGLGKWFQQHQKGLIDFWMYFGRAAIVAGGVIINAVGVVVGAIATLVKGISWMTRSVAWVFDTFGGDGIAESVRGAADSLSELGNDAYGASGKLFGLNGKLIDGWDNLGDFADAAKDAVGKTQELGESANDAAPQLITITDALSKFGVTNNDTSKAIEGSQEEWQKFLKTLKDKGAPQTVIDALKNLRSNFENGGRAAGNYAKAIKQLGDSSVDASTKASALIKSLQEMKRLPGEATDALTAYNQAIDEATKFNANLVEITDKTGNSLVLMNGKLDSNFKNARTLEETIKGIREDAYALAATGEYAPGDVWQRTHDSLIEVAKQFGITGETAEKLITTYLLPKHDFEVQFLAAGKEDVQQDLARLGQQLDQAKKDGKTSIPLKIESEDPEIVKKIIEDMGLKWDQFDLLTKTAIIAVPPEKDIAAIQSKIEELFNADPTTLKSEIKVITSKQDIVNQINNGNPLKIPAVLDFKLGELPPVEVQAPAPAAPTAPPIPLPGLPGQAPNEHGGTDSSDKEWPPQDRMPLTGDPFNLNPELPSGTIQPNDTGGLFRFRSMAKKSKEELAANLLAPNPILESGAHQQGMNFGNSFAQGIRDSIPNVLQAALELATASTDPLGHSPAKIGPLAGSGWTYFRGRTYSEAYAEGIASGQQAVGGAALSIASSSTDPLTDSFSRMMKDASEWVSLGKHIFDLVSSLTDMTFNALNLAQQISGGRLFPKQYQRDPNAKKNTGGMSPWYPNALDKTKDQERYLPSAENSAAVTPGKINNNSSKQQIADYIINKAMSQGYSRKQANDFVVQAFGESGLNPLANGGNQDGTGDVRGIFQFTPGTWGNRPGEITDAQANIDAYFDLAKERGLTPESFTAGSQLGTQVSIGGPWHPQNQAKGHLSAARAGAQEYIDKYGGPGMKNFGPSRAILPGGRSRASQFGGAGTTYDKAFVQSKGMESFYTPGEYEYGDGRLPDWAEKFAQQFGLRVSSSVSASGKDSLHGAGLAFDFNGSRENMTKMAEYIQQNLAEQTLQLIYQDSKTGRKYGIAGGQNVGSGSGSPYYDDSWGAHNSHVHWASDVPVGGGYAPLTDAQRSSKFAPVPVTLGPNSIDAQANSGNVLDDPLERSGLPQSLADLSANDELLTGAIEASRGVGGGALSDQEVSTYLQRLDQVMADQGGLNTDLGRANVAALGQVRDTLMSNYGMKEAANPLDTAQSIVQNVSGLAGDVFNIIDSSLKSVESTKEIGDTLVRGIANTEDVYKIVENVQSFIELGKNIAQTTSDALGFAGMLTSMGAAGDPSGGTAGAAAALSAASGIASLVAQGYATVNAVIDIGQEVYRLGTKYMGRAMQAWFGLPGASDIKYLLDTMNGQLQVYASENPMKRTTFNTLSRSLGNPQQGRNAPTNNLYIYQGPGQDPRDTMNDAMFAVRSSGIGAFGYAT